RRETTGKAQVTHDRHVMRCETLHLCCRVSRHLAESHDEWRTCGGYAISTGRTWGRAGSWHAGSSVLSRLCPSVRAYWGRPVVTDPSRGPADHRPRSGMCGRRSAVAAYSV